MYNKLIKGEQVFLDGRPYKAIFKNIEIGDTFISSIDMYCPILTCGDVTPLGIVMSVETIPNSTFPYLFKKEHCLVIEQVT